jgi:hypothetical protein
MTAIDNENKMKNLKSWRRDRVQTSSGEITVTCSQVASMIVAVDAAT